MKRRKLKDNMMESDAVVTGRPVRGSIQHRFRSLPSLPLDKLHIPDSTPSGFSSQRESRSPRRIGSMPTLPTGLVHGDHRMVVTLSRRRGSRCNTLFSMVPVDDEQGEKDDIGALSRRRSSRRGSLLCIRMEQELGGKDRKLIPIPKRRGSRRGSIMKKIINTDTSSDDLVGTSLSSGSLQKQGSRRSMISSIADDATTDMPDVNDMQCRRTLRPLMRSNKRQAIDLSKIAELQSISESQHMTISPNQQQNTKATTTESHATKASRTLFSRRIRRRKVSKTISHNRFSQTILKLVK